MKRLVVYYSLGGNTKRIAMKIARALRADIIEIQTVKDYPDDYDVLLGLGKKEVESGYLPQIRPMEIDLSKYGAVLVGTPVWWSSLAPALKKFASNYKWKDVNVFPFVTHDGSIGRAVGDFKKTLRGANIAPLFSAKFEEKTQITPDSEILDWLLEIE